MGKAHSKGSSNFFHKLQALKFLSDRNSSTQDLGVAEFGHTHIFRNFRRGRDHCYLASYVTYGKVLQNTANFIFEERLWEMTDGR